MVCRLSGGRKLPRPTDGWMLTSLRMGECAHARVVRSRQEALQAKVVLAGQALQAGEPPRVFVTHLQQL